MFKRRVKWKRRRKKERERETTVFLFADLSTLFPPCCLLIRWFAYHFHLWRTQIGLDDGGTSRHLSPFAVAPISFLFLSLFPSLPSLSSRHPFHASPPPAIQEHVAAFLHARETILRREPRDIDVLTLSRVRIGVSFELARLPIDLSLPSSSRFPLRRQLWTIRRKSRLCESK